MADFDIERGKEKGGHTSQSSPQYDVGAPEEVSGSRWTRLTDSFRRNPNARVVTQAIDEEGKPLPDQPPVEPALSMQLKNRHLQMIAIGGSIGKWHFKHTTANIY
jgi:amino acid transporter